jgi:hypothetical protein
MKTIELSTPTSKGERTITSLSFQNPKVRHFLSIDGHKPDSVAADVALAAALTGESELIIGEIEPADWLKVRSHLATVYAAFFGIDPQKAKEAVEGKQDDPTKATARPKS